MSLNVFQPYDLKQGLDNKDIDKIVNAQFQLQLPIKTIIANEINNAIIREHKISKALGPAKCLTNDVYLQNFSQPWIIFKDLENSTNNNDPQRIIMIPKPSKKLKKSTV